MKHDYRDQLSKLSSDMMDVSVKLEKIQSLINNLDQNYFSDSKDVHEANNALFLLSGYDEARNFISISNDYIYDTIKLINKLDSAIDLKVEEQ